MSDIKESNVDASVVNSNDGDVGVLEAGDQTSTGVLQRISKTSSVLSVIISGLALFSDGYNAQVIGYMNPVLAELYPDTYTKPMKTRMSNAFLIGEVFGMLFFGWVIDKIGRRTGIFWATFFLVLGIIIATAAHGVSTSGMFWMMIIGRGVAGFGAGGKILEGVAACEWKVLEG